MPPKKDLTEMLGKQPAKPAIRRGQGMRLSTEEPVEAGETAASQDRTNAVPQQPSPPPQPEEPPRVNRGVMLREDLFYECKKLAVDERRKLYEVFEEALVAYLRSKGREVA